VIAEPGREAEAAVRLGRIGFDRVAGFLDGGMGSLASRPELVARTARTSVQALSERLGGSNAPLVVDVRTPAEWNAGHIEHSVNLPLNKLATLLGELPRERELAVVCRSGYRSSIATSMLANAGFQRLLDVVGGMDAWTRSGLALAQPTLNA
jgi:rhodanese-related sulfurtransferase